MTICCMCTCGCVIPSRMHGSMAQKDVTTSDAAAGCQLRAVSRFQSWQQLAAYLVWIVALCWVV